MNHWSNNSYWVNKQDYFEAWSVFRYTADPLLKGVSGTQQLRKSLQELSELNLERNNLFIISHPFYDFLSSPKYIFSLITITREIFPSFTPTWPVPKVTACLMYIYSYPTVHIKGARQFTTKTHIKNIIRNRKRLLWNQWSKHKNCKSSLNAVI